MKILLRTLGLLFLLALAGGGWVAYEAHTFLNTAPETPGREVFYDVPTGARLAQVSAGLVKLGVVTDARKLDLLARYKKWENRLQAGRFALNTGWLPEKVLDELVNGHPVLYRVTVPEGLSWWQTGKILEEAGLVVFEDFRKVVTDPDFLRHYGIPFATAEGFLMPDTYLLKKNEVIDLAQARAVAGRMVDNFWRKTAAVWPGKGKKQARTEPLMTPQQVLQWCSQGPVMLCLGTARGLAPEVLEQCDGLIRPVRFLGYNHLSVRSAAAILADRILGDYC